jgi:hypothetical protein
VEWVKTLATPGRDLGALKRQFLEGVSPEQRLGLGAGLTPRPRSAGKGARWHSFQIVEGFCQARPRARARPRPGRSPLARLALCHRQDCWDRFPHALSRGPITVAPACVAAQPQRRDRKWPSQRFAASFLRRGRSRTTMAIRTVPPNMMMAARRLAKTKPNGFIARRSAIDGMTDHPDGPAWRFG